MSFSFVFNVSISTYLMLWHSDGIVISFSHSRQVLLNCFRRSSWQRHMWNRIELFSDFSGAWRQVVLSCFEPISIPFFKIQVQLLHVVKQILLPSSIDHDARPTRRLGLGLPSHGQVAKPFRALRHIATCRPRDDFYRLLSMELRAMFEDVWRDLRRDPVWSLESKMFQVHLHKRFFRIYSRLLFANNIRFVDLLCSSQKLVVPLLGQVLQRTYLRNMLSPWNELRLIGALKGGKKTRTSR